MCSEKKIVAAKNCGDRQTWKYKYCIRYFYVDVVFLETVLINFSCISEKRESCTGRVHSGNTAPPIYCTLLDWWTSSSPLLESLAATTAQSSCLPTTTLARDHLQGTGESHLVQTRSTVRTKWKELTIRNFSCELSLLPKRCKTEP